MPSFGPLRGGRDARKTLLTGLLLAATMVAYLPALQADFVTWDDDIYVTENPLIRSLSPETVGRFFAEPHLGLYQPLTLLSFALDFQIAGLDPTWYHGVNLALHLLNTIGVLALVLLLAGGFDVALLTAAVFALHPLQVESVAWVTERKNVLYTLFFLASLIAYVRYTQKRTTGLYLAALGAFLLSLLAKAHAVTLAPTLLLVDFLRGRQLQSRKVLLEKVPFFAAALAMGVITVWSQAAAGALETPISPGERLVYGSYNLFQHLQRTLLPVELSIVYPGAGLEFSAIASVLYPIGFLALLALVLWSLRWSRWIAFGAGFLLVNVFPVLQFIPAGTAMMNDRFAYVPIIGFGLLLGWGVAALREREPRWSAYLVAGAAVYLLLLTIGTSARAEVWRDSASLWNDAIDKHPTYAPAYNNRGIHLADSNDLRNAVADYSRAIRLDPEYAKAYNNRASALIQLGDPAAAMGDLARAIELDSTYAEAYYNRGLARDLSDDTQGAVEDYGRAISLDPTLAAAFYSRGSALANMGDLEAALSDFDRAVELRPNHAAAFFRRGVVRELVGNRTGACADLWRASALGSREAGERALARC